LEPALDSHPELPNHPYSWLPFNLGTRLLRPGYHIGGSFLECPAPVIYELTGVRSVSHPNYRGAQVSLYEAPALQRSIYLHLHWSWSISRLYPGFLRLELHQQRNHHHADRFHKRLSLNYLSSI